MENKPPQKKKAHDPLIALKYRGYCRALTPPGDKTTLDDLVNFAKFFLCRQNRVLWKDPVWDTYADEEILIEYFSYLFTSDETKKQEFEADIEVGSEIYGEEIYDWLDRKVRENQEETKKILEEMPERVSFSPDANEDVEE